MGFPETSAHFYEFPFEQLVLNLFKKGNLLFGPKHSGLGSDLLSSGSCVKYVALPLTV